MKISRIEHQHFDDVLALNTASIPHVNLIDASQLQWFLDNASFPGVAFVDEKFAGFMIGLRPGANYQSPNYRWFCDNYDDFAYVDRIAVADWARRRGVAESLYHAFGESASACPVMTCEVNLRPAAVGSMKFHQRLGFMQVGTQETDGGQKEVSLMEKKL